MNVPDTYFDDFREDLEDAECVQRIYEFTLRQVRGLVDYNDEEDVIQEVFFRLTKWPIGNKYNSARHYFSLLRITVRQSIAAYWKRRHSQRNDIRRRVLISELQQADGRNFEYLGESENVLQRMEIKETVKRILGAAESLTPRQQIMFRMRFLECQSHEEIAIKMGISIRTSYRLETSLRQILQRFAYE